MRFGFRVFMSKRLRQLLQSSAAALPGALLALSICTVVLTASLRYPYTLLTVQDTVSPGVCSRLDVNATLVIRHNAINLLENPHFECISTKTSPSVTVCLFDIWHDVYVSRSLQAAGVWEPYLVSEFTEAVRRGGHTAGLVDIGANIGYYSLLAAKLGQRVVAVEPVLDSIERLQHAAYLDDVTDRITVVYNGVADVRTRATLRQSAGNQGDSRIELQVRECTGACPVIISTIVLDDLVDVITFSQAVMKVDIQGSEHRAFQCASRLFAAVHFTHVFMEWEIMRDFYVNSTHTSIDKLLVQQMISFLLVRQFRPYKLVSDGAQPLDPGHWGTWPVNIVWLRLANADEQSSLTRSHYRNWPS